MYSTCSFFFLARLFLRGFRASVFELKLLLLLVCEFEYPLFLELELKLILLPECEFEYPLFLKEDPLMLFDVLPGMDISGLCKNDFLLEEPSENLDLTLTELDFLDGRGGGINARAEICLYIDSFKRRVNRYH